MRLAVFPVQLRWPQWTSDSAHTHQVAVSRPSCSRSFLVPELDLTGSLGASDQNLESMALSAEINDHHRTQAVLLGETGAEDQVRPVGSALQLLGPPRANGALAAYPECGGPPS